MIERLKQIWYRGLEHKLLLVMVGLLIGVEAVVFIGLLWVVERLKGMF